MTYIHVHNGQKSNRGSEGCLTLPPASGRFHSVILDRYPTWKTGTAGAVLRQEDCRAGRRGGEVTGS